MYLEHFGLREPPFRITPHPGFFFDGAERGATLDALLYAILHEEGMVKLTGEIGSGKTMLCRMLLERLPERVETVFLANPSYSREDILYAIADELKLAIGRQRASAVLRALQEHLIGLHGAGRRVVVLIDEAHAMPRDTLEEVRLLSNLETSRHKLLQIALFAQPELDAMLLQPGLRQLKDRITQSFRMRALSQAEVGSYIEFRMHAAGQGGGRVFTPAAVKDLARASGGLIRRINVLADKSLLAAYTENARVVEPRHVHAAQVDAELPVQPRPSRVGPWLAAGGAVAGGMIIGAGLHWWISRPASEPPSPLGVIAATPSAPSPAATPAAAAPPAQGPVVASAVAEQSPRAPSLLSERQEQRVAGFAAPAGSLLRARIDAAMGRLQREPDASYCVELFLSDNTDPARLERFLLRARALGSLEDLYVIPVAAGSRYRVRVVYGAYPDREAAAAAARLLPPAYQSAFRTGLRSYAALRAAL